MPPPEVRSAVKAGRKKELIYGPQALGVLVALYK